ncbi:MAG: hypothetical protein J0I54_11790 [Bosea sp.]|uniref:hypothetical protein n=1 Tax=unclassified Bosea (in: a-proteobacteria) TaxID=2653178 RepID=UPI00096123F7|nr:MULTISPECIES: hypothetical protein [unclassified Bosea (in: a-proteobacteria)]MBN9457300.1 hypothetical protein [Bosea sp. (in: a-proteobacteria)]OJV09704.1 MAG: hypothetical protein BGO20_03320 [Bosea sp. 67-29]
MRSKVRHGANAGEDTRPVFEIETAADHESARHRIRSLRDSTRDEDEEHELQALLEAVRRWDARRPAAMDGKRRKTP